jgi:hypothetical protein
MAYLYTKKFNMFECCYRLYNLQMSINARKYHLFWSFRNALLSSTFAYKHKSKAYFNTPLHY